MINPNILPSAYWREASNYTIFLPSPLSVIFFSGFGKMTEKKKQKQKQKKLKDTENKSEEEKKVVKVQEEEEKCKEKAEKQINNNSNKKRKRKELFPFGNYRSYYGYRIGQDMEEDPRLKVLKKEWFEGKDCLDIGCNSGIITIEIAKKFHCHKILGIDIDSGRIEDAKWHLRKFARAAHVEKSSTKASRPEATGDGNGSQHCATLSSVERKEIARDGLHSEERDLSDIVSFRKENFVTSWSRSEEQYDTILCLSVTKWIHLNWGDDGLITLFSRIWKLLRPGGILVLEPQPWRSYEKNYQVSETTAMNYRTIILRPNRFNEILLDKIGFRKVEDITSALSGSKAGFDRPIFAYYK
ncbi:hypothetical protein JCGZ_07286 [Jatropha curcas]|uniref:RNA methyltransferase n=1 Tax=Jatropha curcas TaxID=180498 RepID=A0A067KN88_JATCU|nr:probable RNA methyltransferase At5g51130 [Jatropha curcas]KDP33715.1 hypothetical protein JCGZ_07286 [Jatropha curcas]